MILSNRCFGEAHGGSSRPVAYLKGARLERSNRQLKARSEDPDYFLSIRPKKPLCRQYHNPQALQSARAATGWAFILELCDDELCDWLWSLNAESMDSIEAQGAQLLYLPPTRRTSTLSSKPGR
jgi:hypothetical protein